MSFTNLPNELVLLIAKTPDQSYLNALVRISQHLYELLLLYLYKYNVRYYNSLTLLHTACQGIHWLAVEVFKAGGRLEQLSGFDGVFLGDISPSLAMKPNVHPQ
ncbi:hypothetical protein BGW36DRAFT_357616 [Talaromyces proteolyticus]|uniref:Uncharacterized protein n=1 Tax=Talaromyces proteolyticus TaxID=1131652 RepID=A0AAD4KWX5_9EURO|nr:uncharacterized protein BGW36DRAFT_357616 [Talaromyces proteolyticus]KAH8700983.1 hypothetical protein BGW36DRAFT_357616 [Talaromyces proteolyticus]